MFQPHGIIAALSTPFFPDETLNEAELRNQVERMVAAGVHGIFTLGTNGENYAMDFGEKVRVMEIVIRQAARRVPVYVGTGCVTTRETVALTRKAAELGADCASIVSPWFAAITQEGLYRHYRAAAEAADLPVLVYNMPARTGVNVHYTTMARLAELPNIVGIKDSSGNFDNTQRYLESCGSRISVLSGNDSLILPILLFGGRGGVAGCANVFPHTMVEIYEAWAAGDLERAKRVQDSIRIFRSCFKYGNPNTIIKIAAGLLGNPVGDCRRPFCRLSDEGMEQLKRTLEICKANGLH